MKLTISKKPKSTAGILYVLVMQIGDETVYKIGVTTRKIEERVAEILSSFFIKYRYFPYCKPKKFSKTDDVYKKEAEMHEHFKEYKYEPEHKFSGSTEYFSGLELESILNKYEEVCT